MLNQHPVSFSSSLYIQGIRLGFLAFWKWFCTLYPEIKSPTKPPGLLQVVSTFTISLGYFPTKSPKFYEIPRNIKKGLWGSQLWKATKFRRLQLLSRFFLLIVRNNPNFWNIITITPPFRGQKLVFPPLGTLWWLEKFWNLHVSNG